MKRLAPILALVALDLAQAVSAVAATPLEGLRKDVAFLADERLEGRMTGSDGEHQAADYIAARLKALGTHPLPGLDGYRQPFEFTAGMQDGGSTIRVTVDGRSQEWSGENVRALSFSDDAEVSGPVVFAGYGLTIPEEKGFGYDSYFGLDVKDKIVVVLRWVPEDVDDETRAVLVRFSGLRYKAMRARELGARALIVVTGPRSRNAGETIPMMFDTALGGSGIAAASVDGDVAAVLFGKLDEGGLEKVQQDLDVANPHASQGFDLEGVEVGLKTRVLREKQTGHNVLAWLKPTVESSDWIVIGAHYDHLGRGERGNSLADKDEQGKVHLGADDNASGVAVLLESARRLAGVERPVNIAIAFWSGEEIGLLGATKFLESGLLDPEDLRAYVNLDMVGRLQDGKLNLQSVGSSPGWNRLIEQTNVVAGLDLQLLADPYLPTDSTAFYLEEIPALHLFTGNHADYHRPSDSAEKLNYEGMEEIAGFTTLLVRKIARLDGPLDYAKVERQRESGDRDAVRAYTGTIPDYTQEVEGLLLSGVVGGGPADKAGLQKGDVIVKFGETEIKNIYDYTIALELVEIDVPLQVEFVRDGERHRVELTPAARK